MIPYNPITVRGKLAAEMIRVAAKREQTLALLEAAQPPSGLYDQVPRYEALINLMDGVLNRALVALDSGVIGPMMKRAIEDLRSIPND